MKGLFLTLACTLVFVKPIVFNSSLSAQAFPRPHQLSQNTAVASSVPEWYAITSKPGSFEFQVPALPQKFTEEHRLISNQLNGVTRIAQWSMAEVLINAQEPNQQGEYYLVGYTDLTKEQVQNLSQSEIFDTEAKYIFEELFKQGERPQYQGSEDVTKEGIQGKYYLAEAFNKKLVLVYYLVNQRLYMNLVISEEPEHIKRFLNSFYVLESVTTSVTPQLY